LLAWHPLAALLAGNLWAVVSCYIVVHWRHPLAVLRAFGLTFGHALGASTWLIPMGVIGWILTLFVLVFTAQLWTFCRQRSVSR
jgi:hypothetical protein